jgi:biopolymer transport protein ExbD
MTEHLVGFQKAIGDARNSPRAPDSGSLTVYVNKTNRIYLGDKSISDQQRLYPGIAEAVHDHRLRHESIRIALVVDQDATWGTVMHIIDAARQAHDDDIGFVVE